jgi:4-hydroxybenzoate polyprenyltransferase
MGQLLRLIRPTEWVKNVFVFAALAFGEKIGDPRAVGLSLAAFFAFCFAASAGYVVNDILDRERDRHHPIKKNRPIASGAVKVPQAIVVIVVMLGLSAALSLAFLSRHFLLAVGGYLLLTLAYSVVLKHRMLLDVITIAVLFVLRAIGGAVAIQVAVSMWLLVCTFMLCLFLGFGKRRCEINMISESGGAVGDHRRTLARYTPDLLNQLLSTSGGIAILTFLLYTMDTSARTPFKNKQDLVYTLPLVVYGIYRYAMLIETGHASGPSELIYNDVPFLVTLALWAMAAVAILYSPMLGLHG